MASIPVVPGSEIVDSPLPGNKISGEAFHRAALMKGQVAASEANLGETLAGVYGEYNQKLQKARDADAFFKADQLMRRTHLEFTEQMAKEPGNYAQYPEQWNSRVDQVNNDLTDISSRMSRQGKKALNQNFQSWSMNTTGNVKMTSISQEIDQTKKNGMDTIQLALQTGDEGAANAANNMLFKSKVIDSSTYKKIADSIPDQLQQRQIENAIASDPINAPKIMDQFQSSGRKVRDPDTWNHLKREATAAAARQRTDNLGDLNQKFDQGTTTTPEQLTAMVKNGTISEGQRIAYQNRVQGVYKQQSSDMAAVIRQEIDNTELGTMKSDEIGKWQEKMGTEIGNLDAHYGNPLNEYLKRVVKSANKPEEQENKVVRNRILDDTKKDFDEGLFVPTKMVDNPDADGKFTKWIKGFTGKAVNPDKVEERAKPDNQWTKNSSDEEVAQARKSYALWQQQITEWFTDHPKATYDEAQAFSTSLKAPYVEAQVRKALEPQAPAQNTKQIDDLLKKYGNGQ